MSDLSTKRQSIPSTKQYITLTFPSSLHHLWNRDIIGLWYRKTPRIRQKFDLELWDESFNSRDKSKKNPLLPWKVVPGDKIKRTLAHAGQDGGSQDGNGSLGIASFLKQHIHRFPKQVHPQFIWKRSASSVQTGSWKITAERSKSCIIKLIRKHSRLKRKSTVC